MNINERLKEVRNTIGLTQGVFAKRIGLSTSYIAGMELGDKSINERTIKLMSAEFEVDEHWLRTGEGTMFSGDEGARVIKAVSLFKSMTPSYQDCALKQMEGLAELCDQSKS